MYILKHKLWWPRDFINKMLPFSLYYCKLCTYCIMVIKEIFRPYFILLYYILGGCMDHFICLVTHISFIWSLQNGYFKIYIIHIPIKWIGMHLLKNSYLTLVVIIWVILLTLLGLGNTKFKVFIFIQSCTHLYAL